MHSRSYSRDRLQVLLDDFNEYRSQTEYMVQLRATRPMRDVGMTKAKPDLEKMDAWCAARGIDSRRWLYWLFARTNFRFAPKLTQLVPSAKLEPETLRKYQALKSTPYLSQMQHREWAQQALHEGRLFSPDRDLSPMAEALKRRYLEAGDPQRCMSEMFAAHEDAHPTWGYHPRSCVCAVCPLIPACIAQLRAAVPAYDPVALRAGAITLEQAQVLAGRAHAP